MKAIDLKLTALLALTLAPLCAVAADIRDTACRTTAECQAEAKLNSAFFKYLEP